MWTQIRLLLQGWSDLDPRCLLKRLQNVSADAKNIHVHCEMRFKGLLSQDFCFEMCTCFRDLTAH